MKLYYRVNDYYPVDVEGSSAASSVRHRVDRVCRCLPNNVELTIYSIVKSKNVSIAKRETHIVSNSGQCITFFVASNIVGAILKGLLSIYLMVYLVSKLVSKENYILIYNLLPANILIYIFTSYIFPSILRKTIFQIEEIYSVYNFSFLKRLLTLLSERNIFKRGVNFIVVNENVKDLIQRDDVNAIVDYGYNSRNGKAIEPITASNKIIYTGRLDFVGGIEVLLQAVSELPTDIKNKIVVTGSGGLKDLVVKRAAELGISYEGFLSDSEYESLLINAKISINPLRSKCNFSSYSFPSKVLQYLEYGCVVISSGIAQPELESYFSDELLTYTNDDPNKLNSLIKETNPQAYDKSTIIKKYHIFMEMKEKKLHSFFSSILRG
ncbi:glycosyltransferase [Citrobacter freundii]|nr:glycosyltransferase [Citrobacter freundii]